MTPESQWEYWKKQYDNAKKAVEVAQKELMRVSRLLGNVSLEDYIERGADNMLAGPIEPVTNENWPGASDMGEYLDRTIPDVSGRDVRGDR